MKFEHPIRRFFIDALILFAALIGFAILLRPDSLQSDSFISAVSILSVIGINACLLVFFVKIVSGFLADRRLYRAKKKELRKQAFKNAKLRQKANVQAQLNKPTFDKRLQSFAARQAFKNAKLRQQANVQAQLNKPAFDERLQGFTGRQLESESSPVKSKAEFWEASDLELGPTPPRSIEFFRMLLQRISKYVGFAK